MKKIRTGPMIKDFTRCCCTCLDFDEEEAESDVIGWVSNYVNGPWPENLEVEDTEDARLLSIKAYIEWRIESSSTGRVRNAIKTVLEAAE